MESFKINTKLAAITMATALIISLPGLGNAGWFDDAKGRVQTTKAKVTNKVGKVGQNITDMELINKIQELNLKEQLFETIALMQEMQSDYDYFTGGAGCASECANFRVELKGVVSDFLNLVYEVPALNSDGALISNLERALNIIDYIPPRTLYLMWQRFDGKLVELRTGVTEIREQLARLPRLHDVSMASDAQAQSTSSGNSAGGFCGWVKEEDKIYLELFQTRLEIFAWRVKSFADMIPDVEGKAAGGAAAGIFGSAGIGIKPTDQIKMVAQGIAFVPEQINWAIKINMLRAKAVCQIAGK